MTMTTDETLRTARARLVARGAELRDRVHRTDQELRRASGPLPQDAPDAAIVLENDEVLHAIKETARRELGHIDHALERIEGGVFSRCEACGAQIEAARLMAVLYATRCQRCAKDS